LAKGVGVDEPNPQLSIKCYERAAELGDFDALNHLGYRPVIF
jgi:TPR repeat protein